MLSPLPGRDAGRSQCLWATWVRYMQDSNKFDTYIINHENALIAIPAPLAGLHYGNPFTAENNLARTNEVHTNK